MVRDGEGASKTLTVEVTGARDRDQARAIGRAIVNSSLVKTALYGEDPNWGRIIAAAGSARVGLDPESWSLYLGSMTWVERGAIEVLSEAEAHRALEESAVHVRLDLGQGDVTATAWGCDLSTYNGRITAHYPTLGFSFPEAGRDSALPNRGEGGIRLAPSVPTASVYCKGAIEMTMMTTPRSGQHLLQNYGRAPLTIVRGEGCELIDDEGIRYLDFVAGIAVCGLGHAHPEITAAIAGQAATLVQCSNLFSHEPAGMLADQLAERSGFDRVFFCNSGAEANEAAIKLARKFAYRNGEKARTKIVACRGSFHGRTFGALAATDNASYQEGFAPLPGGFAFTPFNDIDALRTAIDDETAAFLVEPIQGESGVKPATRAFLEAARAICDERGALLIFDEVQCGMGRLGTLFAFQTFGVTPDAITMAKALANGLPIGALLMRGPCAEALKPLVMRDRLELDAHVARAGRLLHDELAAIAHAHPTLFDEPRGLGLMLGLPVRAPYAAKTFVTAGFAFNVILNAAGANTLRFVPPLIITEGEVRVGMERFRQTIESVLEEA